MAEWAECLVSAVRHEEGNMRVVLLQVHHKNGKKIGSPIYVNRKDFISTLKHGKTAMTIYKKDDEWKAGEKISIITADNEEYIRTDGNSINEDNLGELPGF